MGDIDFLSLPIGNNLWYNDRNRAGTTSGVIEPMTFTVRDFHDLVEIMETQPIWRAEMRRLVLTEDILNLPQEIQALSRSVAELALPQLHGMKPISCKLISVLPELIQTSLL
jgi:hypothetical protein